MDSNIINFLSQVVDSITEIEDNILRQGIDDIKANRRIAKKARTSVNDIIDRMEQIPYSIKEKHPEIAWKEFENLRINFIKYSREIEDFSDWDITKHKIIQLKTLINKSFFS